MTDALRVSVVVVSSGRPDALRRCLLGVSQLRSTDVEVVVVADTIGLKAVQSLPFVDRLILREQKEPNISVARNIGVEAANGELIAFIDDDAVPEPTWVDAVRAAFERPDVGAVTGPVLGRNGISLQWGPQSVDAEARDIPTDPNLPIRDGFARKLQGTNMAFRRDVFDQVGGFDEALTFYLDDTDLAFRVGQAGIETKWAADAVVHHGFEASTRRDVDRVPLSLFDIGASSAVYLRKHAPVDRFDAALLDLEAGQSSRLLRMLRLRKLDDQKSRELMESLRAGIAEGKNRAPKERPLRPASDAFQPLTGDVPPVPIIYSGWRHQAAAMRAQAAEHVANGQPVTLFLFEPTPRKHKVTFTQGGWWEQVGGLYGPADRSEPLFTFSTFKTRLTREIRRISATRGLRTGGD